MTKVDNLENYPEKLLFFSGKKRLPIMLQTELSECSLACLAMVASYYGYETDLVSLRKRFALSGQGVSVKNIVEIAEHMNLLARPVRLEVEAVTDLQTPAILHWDLQHFVVLKMATSKYIVVHDPAAGKRKLSIKEFSKHFTGVAIELTPTENFEEGKNIKRLEFKHFWSSIRGLKRSLIQVLSLALLLQFFSILSPFYMQIVVDDVLLRHDEALLVVLALGFLLLLLIQVVASSLRELVIIHLSNRLSIQMASNLFRHLIRLPMDYFYKRHIGDIVSRFGSLNTLQNLLTTGLIATLVDGILVIVTLIVMFIYSVKLSLIVLGSVLLYALLRSFLYHPFRQLSEESIKAKASLDSHFMESIRAIQTIKIFQKERDREGHWQNYMARSINLNIQLGRWNVVYNFLNSLVSGLENLIVIYVAAMAIMANTMTIGMLFAFISYKMQFVTAMSNLIDKWIEWRMLGLHLERLADIAFTPTEKKMENNIYDEPGVMDYGPSQDANNTIEGRIEIVGLSYKYGEFSQPVFSNLNFSVEPGQTIAVTGPSGCGKTTLIKCLMGLLKPAEGKILIDGKPIELQSHFRDQIAGVMQEDRLLTGTITENIACFSNEIDIERVRACAKLSCIDSEIMSMPMKYNTYVGDMGSTLSGGQLQRIFLARALYRNPKILYLDEATSNLDVENEKAIASHIKRLAITRIIVAHRPETVASADKVVNFKIAEYADDIEVA